MGLKIFASDVGQRIEPIEKMSPLILRENGDGFCQFLYLVVDSQEKCHRAKMAIGFVNFFIWLLTLRRNVIAVFGSLFLHLV
jgi:hypothetical protein